MITIIECKQQCNIEQDLLDFESWFRRVIPAVVGTVQAHLDRRVFETQADLDAAKALLADDDTALDTAMLITEDLRHAMLMMVAHWFENRETVSALTMKSVPMSYQYLLDPYRLMF
jgi:hypothetical protein